MINLQIDGIIYSLQKYGGISTYFNELIYKLNDEKINFKLSLELPSNYKSVELSSRQFISSNKGRIIERYRSSRVINDVNIFHSTYYRTPKSPIPTILTVHDFTYEKYIGGLKSKIHSWQKFKAIQQSQLIICVSQTTKNDLLEIFGASYDAKTFVIPNGVSDNFKPLSNITPSKIQYIVFIGQRTGYKNFNIVAAALEFLPDTYLYCVGGGALKFNEISKFNLSIRSRIKHLGYIDEESLNQIYNNAICLVYPSKYEGFGIPVIESMKAGCPVVCLKTKAILEVGGDALTVVEDDLFSLVEGINKLIFNTPYRDIVIKRGIQHSSIFSWNKTHLATISMYKYLRNNNA